MPTERNIRIQLIDPLLTQAGWGTKRRDILEEYLVKIKAPFSKDESMGTEGRGAVNYVLLGSDGQPIALVEAKRTGWDAVAGQKQAEQYADAIALQTGQTLFIYLTNGIDIFFWDRPEYPFRVVRGFHTPDDLERLRYLKLYRRAFSEVPINTKIAGHRRPYQIEAIKRVSESLDKGHRKFLLVMATGTGKTRTVIGLIDLLIRSKRIQRVLYLVDRVELGRQALGAFKDHLPSESRARIEGGNISSSARIHVATYPSMMQVFRSLSPGHFDLIVADESHRSIYNRYREIFDYFDALQIGLTATPTDYLDHNTFELFECNDGLPTFYYPYEKAVEEKQLVSYQALEAQTDFQISGIKAGELPEEIQTQLQEQGIDLAELDFSGSDLERLVTNSGTVDALIREFMDKCRRDNLGALPAKTIIFAISHAHAMKIWHSFNRLYPDLQSKGLAQVIDSYMERADTLLDDFKTHDMPRVAISVDMLDTGIDVPTIQNLVFAKPVFSQVKFWQMIGRGTRLWKDPFTGEQKKDFLIIDHWNNFAYFGMNPEGEVSSQSEPVAVGLFRARIEKYLLLRGYAGSDADASRVSKLVRDQLRTMLVDLPRDNVDVNVHLKEIDEWSLEGSESRWEAMTPDDADWLSQSLAPLLRFSPNAIFSALSFIMRTERIALAKLRGETETIDKMRDEINNDLAMLPRNLSEIKAKEEDLIRVGSDGFWDQLTQQRILDLQTTFGPLMRFCERRSRELVRLTLPDRIGSRRWIIYGPSGEGAFAEAYREQVEATVRNLANKLPGFEKLRTGEPLTLDELQALADALNLPDLFITETILKSVYEQPQADLSAVLRHILGFAPLPTREERIRAEFDAFIAKHPRFTASQLNFIRTVCQAVTQGATLTEADLAKAPFSRIGQFERLFRADEVDEFLKIAYRQAA